MKKAKYLIKAVAVAVFGLLSSCTAPEEIDANDIDRAANIGKALLPLVKPEK
jgi:hypothetical protein